MSDRWVGQWGQIPVPKCPVCNGEDRWMWTEGVDILKKALPSKALHDLGGHRIYIQMTSEACGDCGMTYAVMALDCYEKKFIVEIYPMQDIEAETTEEEG